jgi:8-oxo-dGTP diphosphatase
MGDTKEMVLGFVFSQDLSKVLLVNKQNAKQEWQNGLDNGLGGKLEDKETIEQAMRREFKEESGFDIENWVKFGSMGGTGWNVTLFTTTQNLIPAEFSEMTREGLVRWCEVGNLPETIIKNLAMLVPAARYKLTHRDMESVRFSFV